MTHPGPPSQYVRIPVASVREIHGRCAALATLGLVACLALASAIVGFGRALPTADHPINALAWGVGCASVVGPLLSSISLGMARSYAWGEQFDAFRMWQARRALTGGWVSSALFVPLSWFLLVMTARSVESSFTGAVWAYLLLLALPAALAGVLSFCGRASMPALR